MQHAFQALELGDLKDRYVDTTEPIEVPSVEEALARLREAEQWRDEAAARMDELLAELGYPR